MKRKLPTVLILLAMVLLGAMYWVDLSYYTEITGGFVPRGEEWLRYLVLLPPLAMALLGLRTVGPRAIAVLRVRSAPLAVWFGAAALVGVGYGATRLVTGLMAGEAFGAIVGGLFVWYGIWMFLCALQLFMQNSASPTHHAIWGVLAALPLCAQTVYRVMINPSTLYRIGSVVSALSALLAMIWFSFLLRAFYVALPQNRVRWMYFLGLFTFLFCVCFELPATVHGVLFGSLRVMDLFDSLNMAMLGITAGSVSVAIAGQSDAGQKTEPAAAI